MKIIVTGREGQVVRSLVERVAQHPSIEVVALGRPELDLARPDGVLEIIRAAKPDLVVSAAAYTAVDQAEDEPDLARTINTDGAAAVAQAAAALSAPIIHLSTDYVFSGEGERAYREDDPTGPRSVYGQTKLDGERAVARANSRHIILRTAWVYGPFGKNFAKTMLRLGQTRSSVSVVSDQWGNPTSSIDIADAVLHVADRLRTDRNFDKFGTYHLAGSGNTNWSGFAREIFAQLEAQGGSHVDVEDIVTSAYPTKAVRPANSRLNTDRFFDVFNWRAPDWKQSTATAVQRILRESNPA